MAFIKTIQFLYKMHLYQSCSIFNVKTNLTLREKIVLFLWIMVHSTVLITHPIHYFFFCLCIPIIVSLTLFYFRVNVTHYKWHFKHYIVLFRLSGNINNVKCYTFIFFIETTKSFNWETQSNMSKHAKVRE